MSLLNPSQGVIVASAKRLTRFYSSFHVHQRNVIESMIRVDQAGEIAANLIYRGQHDVLRSTPDRSLIEEMWESEKRHLEMFNTLVRSHDVRPTLMMPVWTVLAYGMGVCTAALGREAAMACTEAVETVVAEHYNDQLRDLHAMTRQMDPDSVEATELHHLRAVIKECRDEELAHLNTAVDNDAHSSPFYQLLSGAVKGACKTAIAISKIV